MKKIVNPIRLTIGDRVYAQAVLFEKTRDGYEQRPVVDSCSRPVFALPGGGRATEEEIRRGEVIR